MGMKGFEIVTELDIALNRDMVFHLIDLYPGNPIYDEVVEEYDEIESKVRKLVKAKAIYKFSSVSKEIAEHAEGKLSIGSPVLYVLMTIGNEISDMSSDYFVRGDYLLGMLVNAMADTYLFQMDDILKDRINESCILRHLGIEKRLDAPENIPMQMQKDILIEIKEVEDLPMDVTEGFMFTTVKTLGYILVLTEDETKLYSGHNCSACSQKNCKMRRA